MLKALDAMTRLPTLAWDADEDSRYLCPECDEALVQKHGVIARDHFAHCPASSCAYGTGESFRHLTMKTDIGRQFSYHAGLTVDYEASVVPNHRADVHVATPDGPFVVECQVSPLSIGDWEARTLAYQRAGIAVLWLWDVTRLGFSTGFLFERLRAGAAFEARIPAEVRYCHMLADERIYGMDTDGVIRGCRLLGPEERVFRDTAYVPETKRAREFWATWLTPEFYATPAGGRWVSLGDDPQCPPRIRERTTA